MLDKLVRPKEYDEIVITDPNISVGTEIMECEAVRNDDKLPKLR